MMSQEPLTAEAWLERAEAEEADDRPEAALEAVDQALSRDASLGQAWRLKASLLLDLDREDEALETLARATDALPQEAGLWFERGAALVGHHPDSAANCFARTRELDPTYPRVMPNLGIALLAAGRCHEAVGALEDAVRESPLEAHLWSRLGEASLGAQRCHRAVECFDRSLELAPEDYVALGNRALALCHLSRPEPALKTLEKAMELAPEEPRLWAIRGMLLEQAGQGEEALAAYDRSLELNPRDPDTWHHKAQYLQEHGRTEESVQCRRQAFVLSGRLKAWGMCLLDEKGQPVPGTEAGVETDLPPEAIAHRFLSSLLDKGHTVDDKGLVDGRFQAALWEIPLAGQQG